MPICHATLMCHAPIVVPAVGRERGKDCTTTTAAMREAARGLAAANAEALIVISPHTPRAERAWGLLEGDRVAGDFGAFGAPGARVDLPAATEVREAIHAVRTVPTARVRTGRLDHGAAVPLWFAQEAGWRGPTVVIALPWDEHGVNGMGEAIRAACERSGQRWAVLASGDMSHRLIPGAPAGYHPRAREFDAAFVDAMRKGDVRGAVAVAPGLRELAAEDVISSVAVAGAAIDWRPANFRFLAYEGPFGVGYCEAVLFAEAEP